MMMTGNFRPGMLTARDAETLNEFVRKVSALLSLSVAPPLSMTRNNGIPSGLTIALPPGVALARITGNDAATPPVYQATIETRDDANAVEDTYPVSTIENLLSPVGDTFATDELVYAVPIADQPGWYWGFPASGYTPPATNTATSVAGGWLAGLLSTSCLSLTVLGGSGACSGVDTTQVLTLVYDTGTWASTTDFTYDTGAGPVVLSITADGLPKLTIDGIAGVGDGGGIDSNGDCFFDFAFGGTTLCDGTATACCGNIFRVRLTCSNCPDVCCPDDAPPDAVYLTVTSTACPSLARVVTLNYGTFYGPFLTGGMWYAATGYSGNWWVLYCDSGSYILAIWTASPLLDQNPSIPLCSNITLTKDACNPFHLSFTVTSNPLLYPMPSCLGLSCANPTDQTYDIVE